MLILSITCNSSREMPSGGMVENSCTSGEPEAAYDLPSSESTHLSLLISCKSQALDLLSILEVFLSIITEHTDKIK